MKFCTKRLPGVAALTLAGGLVPCGALAQSQIYTYVDSGGSHQYSLLNGSLLALYINDRGDLGAPYRNTGTTKPVGFVDSNFAPFINPDGSVDTTTKVGGVPNGTYGILYNPNGGGSGSLADQVRAKREYLTVGGATVAEGYALVGDNDNLHIGANWLQAASFNVKGFTAAGNSVTSQLFRQTGAGANQGLQLSQTVTIVNDSNLVQFSVHFKNTDATALTGLRYARVIDPNEGGSASPSTSKTSQSFRTNSDLNAFAINSTAGSRQLALGVLPGDPGTAGTRIIATTTTRENDLLSNPDDNLFGVSNSRYVTLGTEAGKPFSATYFKGSTASQTVDDFRDPNFNPNFGAAQTGDVGLALESPFFDLQSQEEQTFNFYYFLDPKAGGGSVPEPGTLALLCGGVIGGMSVLRRKRRA